MPAENYYTPDEIAAEFKVSRQAVYNWVAEGRLRAIKVGKALRIPRDAWEEFIKPAGGRSEAQDKETE